eukprot:CCRYP_000028-RB/>CCRYP_000028-RB protein AED:0.05 eAED:0.05 QI:190/1/1/1/0.5/0.33/3/1190/396
MSERATQHHQDETKQDNTTSTMLLSAPSTKQRRRFVHRPNAALSAWSKRKLLFRIASLVFLASLALAVLYRGMSTHSLSRPGSLPRLGPSGVHLRGGGGHVWVHSDSQLFNERSVATQATHLIIVAGHSVLISGQVENAPFDESVWYLLDYQRNKGLPHAIVSHIQTGIRLALHDEKSLLVFSGGETRAQTGPDTEGASYFRVADALDLWDGRDVFGDVGDESHVAAKTESMGGDVGPKSPLQSTVRARTITEEYATDSFENLMFSICRFHDITGTYPQKITMVSFSFKQQRFETLHANALQWPLSRFQYVGVDPPSSTGFDLQEASDGERNNSLIPFKTDPYGCHTEVLQKKRRERNPFARMAPYELTCPDMKELLKWCGPSVIPKSKVPWSNFM